MDRAIFLTKSKPWVSTFSPQNCLAMNTQINLVPVT